MAPRMMPARSRPRWLLNDAFHLLVVVVCLGAVGYFLLVHVPLERRRFISQLGQGMSLRNEMRRMAVDQWLREGLEDTRAIAIRPTVLDLLRLADGEPVRIPYSRRDAVARLTDALTALSGIENVSEIHVVDRAGRPVLATAGAAPLQRDGELAVRDVLARGRPWIAPVSHEDGGTYVLFAVPCRAAPGGPGRGAPLGVVLVHLDMAKWLYPFILATQGDWKTAEALLVRKDGDSIQFLSPLRYSAAAPLRMRVAATPGLAAREALSRSPGFGSLRDYRGVPAFAVYSRLETVPWGVVVKVDRSEVLGEFNRRTRALGIAWGLALVAFLSLLAISWREVVRAREHDLVRKLNLELEAQVRDRTSELERVNLELEGFARSVSHDLRAPLRAVEGFARILHDEHSSRLDAEGRRLLDVVRDSARTMGRLIDDLLAFSRAGRHEITRTQVDMKGLARAVFHELVPADPRADVEFRVDPLPDAWGDAALLRQVWANLIGNALKFSARQDHPVIEVGWREEPGRTTYFVRDNGAGFDMRYADKLFEVFQRLHSHHEFEGTGVGLALVQRIVQRHGGEVRAEGAVGRGATVSFTLPHAERGS